MRIIDAHKLINALDGMREEFQKDGNVMYALIMCMVIQYIKSHHELDANPIKHGEWEKTSVGEVTYCVCSECDTAFTSVGSHTRHGRIYSAYCPNCGAKMDGKESDNEQA